MANMKLTKVEIDNVDVSSYLLSWEIQENFGNPVYSAKITLTRNVTSAVTLDNAQSVEVWEGFTTATDTKIFDGFIETYEPEPGKIVVKAYNKLYAAVRTLVTTIYDASVGGNPINPSGKYSDAFYDLITTYAGLTATNGTSIQDSGTTLTISKLICFNTPVKERIDRIAESLNWVYYYQASDDTVYFKPKQFSTNATILTVGSNVVNVPKWRYDKTDLINDLRVDGAYQENFVSETFSGNGSTTVFTLAYTPVGDVGLYYDASKNYQTTAKTEQEKKILGVTSSTSTSFDYTVDKATRKVTTTSFTPASATNNILVEYVASIPVPIHMIDELSKDTYGRHQRSIILRDVITVLDAESRTLEVLSKFKDPFQSAILQVKHTSGYSFMVGQSVQVIDAQNNPNVNDTFTIFGITRRYPGGFDELMVGDREFDPPEFFINISDRIHALEQELYNENGVLVELRSATMDLTLEPHSLVVDEYYMNDSFIADHAVNGVVYSSGETSIVDDFEAAASWAQGTGSVALTETADSTAGHFWIGTQGLNYSWIASSGTGVIDCTDSQGDLQNVVGVTSGTPSRGTAGVWVYSATPASISSLTLRIGSSSTDYKEYQGKQYAWGVAGDESSFALDSSLLTYVVFDLDAPTATSGTTDWTAIDFCQFRWGIAAAGNMTFDYFTVSRNNTIALNGLGDRRTLKATTTTNY